MCRRPLRRRSVPSVAISTVRYDERRGLLVADVRRSGQRRYSGREPAPDWKAIAARRLYVLDAEIARLELARSYLRGALLCCYDHPASDCKVMGAEIDGRLASPAGRRADR